MPHRTSYPPGTFCWVDLTAHDMNEAIAWYGEQLGWRAEHQDTRGGPPYAQFVYDAKVVAGIGQMSDEMKGRGIPPTWNSYVCVEDAKALEPKVRELGGTVVVPTMKVLEAGSLAYFTDPEGAMFAVWQPDRHAGAALVDEPRSLAWNEKSTRDKEGTTSFYGKLFGWTFEDAPAGGTPYTTIETEGRDNGGIIVIDPSWGDAPAMWLVYFAHEDVQAASKRIQASGGGLIMPPTPSPAGPFAVVTDPQGAVFALITMT